MNIFKIVGFAFISLSIVLIFKGRRDDLATEISLAAGIVIFLLVVPKLTIIVNFLQLLSHKANIDVYYLNLVFKILGIAYITSFCSEVCKDAGVSGIGNKVELAGKIIILSLSIPILMAVLDAIIKII
ncbi:stage III sporulation protein AD [Hathewaya histolytica]|uniref:Stage III sporulation protein AD n=1 Tax=Hathewaya histolytica TaxID=1498 RepID=A0A4U9RB28_HATHI|nr:stage III sporulation protein AD [Hathewaya histolytica]VTQ88128.1 stage III sporulation protein AD [Hathewaya histolytica]